MKRRNCYEVINQMIAKIPKTKTELLKDLQWNYEDAIYKPPEQIIQWNRTQYTLIKHIPKPKEDWEFEVLSIFTTKTVKELKEVFNNT